MRVTEYEEVYKRVMAGTGKSEVKFVNSQKEL